ESGAFSGPGCDYAYLVSSFSESLEQLRYIREKLYQLVCLGPLVSSVYFGAFFRRNFRKFSCHGGNKRFSEELGYVVYGFFVPAVMPVCVLPGFYYDIVGVDQRAVEIENNGIYHSSPCVTYPDTDCSAA